MDGPPGLSANAKKKAKKKAAKSNAQTEGELANRIKNAFAQKPAPKPKAQPANRPKKDFVNLPAALVGMCARTNAATNNQRLCFAFNLGTCSAVAPGQTCARGAHLCMKPAASGEACSQPHGALKCSA